MLAVRNIARPRSANGNRPSRVETHIGKICRRDPAILPRILLRPAAHQTRRQAAAEPGPNRHPSTVHPSTPAAGCAKAARGTCPRGPGRAGHTRRALRSEGAWSAPRRSPPAGARRSSRHAPRGVLPRDPRDLDHRHRHLVGLGLPSSTSPRHLGRSGRSGSRPGSTTCTCPVSTIPRTTRLRTRTRLADARSRKSSSRRTWQTSSQECPEHESPTPSAPQVFVHRRSQVVRLALCLS